MKTVIEMAKEAGWEYADDDRGFEPLWRFAELVRADERARMTEQPAQQEPTKAAELVDALIAKYSDKFFDSVGPHDAAKFEEDCNHIKQTLAKPAEAWFRGQLANLAAKNMAAKNKAQPQQEPTDGKIDAAVKAWFGTNIIAGPQPFAKRMRAALKAAHNIKEQP